MHLCHTGKKHKVHVYITGRKVDLVAKAAADLGTNVIFVLSDAASIADSGHLAETIAANGDKLDG